MNPFLQGSFASEVPILKNDSKMEDLSANDNYFVFRSGEVVCTVNNINKLPDLVMSSLLEKKQDALWILSEILKHNEQREDNRLSNNLDLRRLVDPLTNNLKDIDLESSFLSLKTISSLITSTDLFDRGAGILFENLKSFIENIEIIQFQCLKLAMKVLSQFQTTLNDDVILALGEIISTKFSATGKSLITSQSKNTEANLDFLTTMRNNFQFCFKIGLFENKKLIKIICENLASENKNERLLGLEILLDLSKDSKGSKFILEKISFQDIYNMLEKDKSDPLIEAIIMLCLHLSQHKKDLQEKIMEFPSIFQLLVYFLEKAFQNVKENRNFILDLAQLLSLLVEYPPIRVQVSQYGIFTALSTSKITSQDSAIKEEILKLVQNLANVYHDYELIFQTGMIGFISENIVNEKDQLIEEFVDFMIKAANSGYLTKKNLGLENVINLEEIVKKTKSHRIRTKIDDLNVLLDQEKVISKSLGDLHRIKEYSAYHVNSEKVKYQQLLNFKIESLVNHIVKTQKPRKIDQDVEKMISNIDLKLQSLDLDEIKKQAENDLIQTSPNVKHTFPGEPLAAIPLIEETQPQKGVKQKKPNATSPNHISNKVYDNLDEDFPDQRLKSYGSLASYNQEDTQYKVNAPRDEFRKEPRPRHQSEFETSNEISFPKKAKDKYLIPSKTETDENYYSKLNPRNPVNINNSQDRQNFSVGRTRPVKPISSNYSTVSGEPAQNHPTLLRNPSRDRRRNSLKQIIPLQKGQRNPANEDQNNLSMVENYSQGYYESNFYDQTANQSFDVSNREEAFIPVDKPRNTKQDVLRLPKLNPNLNYYHNRTTDYNLQPDESKSKPKSKLPKGKNEKKIPGLPKIEVFPFSEVEGIDQLIAEKYLDLDFTNSTLKSSKMLRHYMKLGIPETKGISNVTGVNSVKGLISWFSRRISQQDPLEVVEHLQTAIGSSSRTAFLVCIIVSLGEKLGVSFERFRNDQRITIE